MNGATLRAVIVADAGSRDKPPAILGPIRRVRIEETEATAKDKAEPGNQTRRLAADGREIRSETSFQLIHVLGRGRSVEGPGQVIQAAAHGFAQQGLVLAPGLEHHLLAGEA